jgi:hypothetical protein
VTRRESGRGDDPVLETKPGASTYDRELDLLPQPAPRFSSESLEDNRRVIVNPFLAIMSCGLAVALVRAGVQRRSLLLFLCGIGLLPLAILLIQFHCLDCGATGWLLRSWAHACPAVVTRRQSQRVSPFRRPGLGLQLFAWFIVIMAAFIFGMVMLG